MNGEKSIISFNFSPFVFKHMYITKVMSLFFMSELYLLSA